MKMSRSGKDSEKLEIYREMPGYNKASKKRANNKSAKVKERNEERKMTRIIEWRYKGAKGNEKEEKHKRNERKNA